MKYVSRVMIISIGRATMRDHRSAAWAARDLGVISPKTTMNTVRTRLVRRTVMPLSPNMEKAIAVPTEEARMIKAFSVNRMVAKNFSCLCTTLFAAWAGLLPCYARCRMRNLFTEMRLASALLKKATINMLPRSNAI